MWFLRFFWVILHPSCLAGAAMLRILLPFVLLLTSIVFEVSKPHAELTEDAGQHFDFDHHQAKANLNSFSPLLEDYPEVDEENSSPVLIRPAWLVYSEVTPTTPNSLSYSLHWHPENPRAPPV
jgi:hypothetical protein